MEQYDLVRDDNSQLGPPFNHVNGLPVKLTPIHTDTITALMQSQGEVSIKIKSGDNQISVTKRQSDYQSSQTGIDDPRLVWIFPLVIFGGIFLMGIFSTLMMVANRPTQVQPSPQPVIIFGG